jgi:hypothetical protein
MAGNASNTSYVLDKVESILRNVEGTVGVYPLSRVELRRILELEEKHEENASGSSTRCLNLGVREVSKRQVALAVVKTCNFPRPVSPTIVLVSDGVIVGEEIVDSAKNEELEKNPKAILIDRQFVMYQDRVKSHPASDSVFQFPPTPFPLLEKMEEIRDVVSASPSALSDLYIKEKGGWQVADPQLGTILIGFDLLR